MTKFIPMQEIQSKIRANFQGQSIPAEILQVVANLSFSEGKMVTEVEGLGEVSLTPHGFETLVKDRLDFGPAFKIFGDPNIATANKLALIQDKANSLVGPAKDVYLKATADRSITAVLSREFSQIDNWDIGEALETLIQEEVFPPDLEGHSLYLHNGYMNLRLVSRGVWTQDYGNDPYYGAVVIENDELGGTAFRANFAVNRLACTNYSIGEEIAAAQHRWGGKDDFLNLLRGGAAQVEEVFNFFDGRFARMREITPDYPNEMLLHVLKKVGMSQKYLRQEAEAYLDSGGGNSMYDVHNAVTYAIQAVSKRRGRKLPQWNYRTRVEREAFTLGVDLINKISEGYTPEELYLTPEVSLLDRVSTYLRQRAEQFEGETAETLTEVADQVLVFDME